MHKAFLTPYVVQDDARQHVFWMWRFVDPGLFPNDLIADYFQSIAPPAYTFIYHAGAALGVDPITFDKILPVALGWIAVLFGALLARRLLDVPAAAFLVGVLVAQDVWMMDDVPSGTARAFGVPLVLAFVYFLTRRSRVPCLGIIALQGLFYPQAVIFSAATLACWALRFEGGRVRLSQDRVDLAFAAAGIVLAALTLLPFLLDASRFGPVITVGEARALPEFGVHGRTDFFGTNLWRFWVEGQRSGLLPKLFSSGGPFRYVSIPLLAGFLLPWLLARPDRYPLAGRVRPEVAVLGRLALAALALFFAAHALLFRLHLPSRYSGLGVHVALPVAAGLALAILLDRMLSRLEPGAAPEDARRGRWKLLLAAVLGALIVASPFLQRTEGNYAVGHYPGVYAFFAAQPVDVRIASLSLEANNIPSFSRRSVLANRETMIPYHTGYYRQVRRRTLDLMRAEYAEDPGELVEFIERYEPDFLLVERDAFKAAWVTGAWIDQFHPESDEIVHRLERGSVPALAGLLDRCSAFQEKNLVVLRAGCLVEAAGRPLGRGRDRPGRAPA
jgi:hypothetical protein